MRIAGNRRREPGNAVGGGRLLATGLGASMLLLAGCRQDMHNQPKFYPQRGTDFYTDGRSVRPQVENTVGRNQLHENAYFYTGFINGKEGDGLPIPVSVTMLHRGQQSYNVYCTPCHSRVGNGAGMIVQRGYAAAGNLHADRLRQAPLGHFFNVISNGYGAMPDYAAQIAPEDRWAVVAYIRALQLSQNAAAGDVGSGSHVEPLSDIAQRSGFAPGFVEDWRLPSTAVKGTPAGKDYVIPIPVNNLPSSGAGPQGSAGQAPARQVASPNTGLGNATSKQ